MANNFKKVIVDNIKEFPKDISIDMANVYQQFGKEAPTLGEIVATSQQMLF